MNHHPDPTNHTRHAGAPRAFPTRSEHPTAEVAEQVRALLTNEVAESLALEHGVCVRPLAMRTIDLETGEVRIVARACESRQESVCPTCAEKHRRLRVAQCREGWHLDEEPVLPAREPTEQEKDLMTCRADLVAAYAESKADGDEDSCEHIRDAVRVVDEEIRAAGIKGHLVPLDPMPAVSKRRSTRRRQNLPDLPRKPVDGRTVGRVFAGKYRPSQFVTLTLPSYGAVRREDGAALDPERYDYRRAARDAIHFPKLLGRWMENLRRCVGWDVQHFGSVEPQKRGAPHAHYGVRGSIPHETIRQVTAATDYAVWWPKHDELVYGNGHLPVWDDRAKGFVDPDTREPLPTFDQAREKLDEPAHVIRFGEQVHSKGILGGTPEAGRHIGYLTKYLTKSITETIGLDDSASDAKRAHVDRLHTELMRTPCNERCAVWLLYGIEPRGARLSTVPGCCKGKAHTAKHLGIGGRRCQVSRKWSGKTLDHHRAKRAAFVRELLTAAGIEPRIRDDEGIVWERTAPGDSDVPPRAHLLLQSISERQRWNAEMRAAQLHAEGRPPDDPNNSATGSTAKKGRQSPWIG